MSARRKREKIFGRGQGRPLDGNAKARIMAFARFWSARNRRGRQHTGPITRAYMAVLEAMLFRFHNSKTGECFPSMRKIAERARCSKDTVNEAIKILELSGILTYSHRIYRKLHKGVDGFGQKVTWTTILRASNAYEFRDQICPKSSLTENPPPNKASSFISLVPAAIERKIDPEDRLERALGGLGAAIKAREC